MAQSKQKSKKAKPKILTHNLVDTDEDSEHELFYYAGNRIQLMKEVLKLIKPKKIKSIAPNCLKNLDIEEINSMLLEELLGISNKRLKHILNGEKVDEETSSSESDEDKPIDVISLDDISDSEDDFGSDGVNTLKNDQKGKKQKGKKVPKPIKKEKQSNPKTDKVANESENEKLMSVLEILELQARARAIRSQLALENISKKQNELVADVNIKEESSEESDAIVVDSPKNDEIVITSSDSENEGQSSSKLQGIKRIETVVSEKNDEVQQVAKIIVINSEQEPDTSNKAMSSEQEIEKQQFNSEKVIEDPNKSTEIKDATSNKKTGDEVSSKDDLQVAQHEKSDSENDDVINLDIEEMEND